MGMLETMSKTVFHVGSWLIGGTRMLTFGVNVLLFVVWLPAFAFSVCLPAFAFAFVCLYPVVLCAFA